jgi:uncharacterized protein (TIGR02001 family)
MRILALGLAASLVAVAAPALAQDAPASDFTVSGGATLVTDYRFRGISQTFKQFAVQGTFTVSHSSGLYATVWGSSIDDYVAFTSDQEIDLIAGYKHSFGAATVDVGVLYYYYPGSLGFNTDFFEPYASVSGAFGPVNAKLSAAYAPKQKALSLDGGLTKEDNLYVAGDLSASVPNTPIGLTAHVGHSFGPSCLTACLDAPTFTNKEYTDWGVGATYTWKNLVFGVQYVDTDENFIVGTRNVSKAGVVGSVGVSF